MSIERAGGLSRNQLLMPVASRNVFLCIIHLLHLILYEMRIEHKFKLIYKWMPGCYDEDENRSFLRRC